MLDFQQRIDTARILSWNRHGRGITFFLPGMFRLNGHHGRYPAISITGRACELKCDHCAGKILESMPAATSSSALLDLCQKLADQGQQGVLISGGCKKDGTLPWPHFLKAIESVKAKTKLFISVHSGLVDLDTAKGLKEAGVDQALIDVIGSDRTFQSVYHVPFGVERIVAAMDALSTVSLPMVPHIVCGLDHGHIKGEYQAVKMISRFPVAQVVIVSLMPLSGTPMAKAGFPTAEQVADIIADARIYMPHATISLGCARQRGNTRMEELAIEAGVNRMALPSEEAVAFAQKYGLNVTYQPTCCSVPVTGTSAGWH